MKDPWELRTKFTEHPAFVACLTDPELCQLCTFFSDDAANEAHELAAELWVRLWLYKRCPQSIEDAISAARKLGRSGFSPAFCARFSAELHPLRNEDHGKPLPDSGPLAVEETRIWGILVNRVRTFLEADGLIALIPPSAGAHDGVAVPFHFASGRDHPCSYRGMKGSGEQMKDWSQVIEQLGRHGPIAVGCAVEIDITFPTELPLQGASLGLAVALAWVRRQARDLPLFSPLALLATGEIINDRVMAVGGTGERISDPNGGPKGQLALRLGVQLFVSVDITESFRSTTDMLVRSFTTGEAWSGVLSKCVNALRGLGLNDSPRHLLRVEAEDTRPFSEATATLNRPELEARWRRIGRLQRHLRKALEFDRLEKTHISRRAIAQRLGFKPSGSRDGMLLVSAPMDHGTSALLPHRHSKGADGGLRTNLAIRWGLCRRSGVVIIHGGEFDRVFFSFVEAEDLLQEATWKAKRAEMFPPRVWLKVEDLPSAKANKGAWLAALSELHTDSAEEWGRLESDDGSLGVVFRPDAAVATPQGMRELISSIASLVNETMCLEPLLVIHTDSRATATSLATQLSPLIDSVVDLRCEVLEMLSEFSQSQSAPASVSSWKPPSLPGHALLRFCRQLDPDGNCMRRQELRELHAALGRFDRTGFALESDATDSLPHVEDIVTDLALIEGNEVEAVRSLLRVTKNHRALKALMPALVKAMASREPKMREAALEAAVPNLELVDAWLAGLTASTRLGLPRWWVNANPAHLESVLAALIRQAKQGDPEARQIAEAWLPIVNPWLRETAKFVLENTGDVESYFCQPAQSGKSLLFLMECEPEIQVPIDKVSPLYYLRPEFWQMIQRLPVTIELVRRFVFLDPKYRAVIGLCSAGDWATLTSKHTLLQAFIWRGCPYPGKLLENL